MCVSLQWQVALRVFFFFQAEDGIRDLYVTGVQTCALPISTRRLAGLVMVATVFLIAGSGLRAFAQAPAAGQDAGPAKYTMAEYNAYQGCAAEKAPAALIKCLDDFVSKYPNSTLLNYVYPLYYQAYSGQKNYLKMIESADKLAALGDKVDALTRFNAYYTHATAYYAMVSDPTAGPSA